MLLKAYFLIGLSLLLSLEAKAAASYEITQENLKNHVQFLSSDSLEGRLTGSVGEKLATEYIAERFKKLGLTPAGDNGTYFQNFDFTAGVSLGKNNTLVLINEDGISKTLTLNQDWRPLTFSDNVTFRNQALIFAGYGISAPNYDSYNGLSVKGKWVIVYRYLPDKISKQESRNLSPYSSLRIKTFNAKEHGASGIIFVDPPHLKTPHSLIPLSSHTTFASAGIGVISARENVLKFGMKISGQVDIKKNIHQGRNVLAKLNLNNTTREMIVIGAHADHLGHGEISSRARGAEKGMIHQGADDNASGVASMLEASAKLSDLKAHGKLKGQRDILFAAWSGEEFGVLGSSHFVNHLLNSTQTVSLRPLIATAINLDMVGHLREQLALQGTGSSVEWPRLIKALGAKQSIAFILQNDPYLPTDSTSFYLHGVPTLNFFTGAHEDYHTPRDRPETLNYKGLKKISDLLVALTLLLEKKQTILTFHQTPQDKDYKERDFKVYLGTIPDYVSTDVSGVKLSGVSQGSPAEIAGLQQGDIIVKLAEKHIHNIYDYTFVLKTLPVGKEVGLIVVRDHTLVALKITARYR